MTVTVFAKPHCPQCMATMRQMKKQGVAFESVNLAENPETLQQLVDAGYKQAPIVITPDASWSGYRPDLIKALSADSDDHADSSNAAAATKAEEVLA